MTPMESIWVIIASAFFLSMTIFIPIGLLRLTLVDVLPPSNKEAKNILVWPAGEALGFLMNKLSFWIKQPLKLFKNKNKEVIRALEERVDELCILDASRLDIIEEIRTKLVEMYAKYAPDVSTGGSTTITLLDGLANRFDGALSLKDDRAFQLIKDYEKELDDVEEERDKFIDKNICILKENDELVQENKELIQKNQGLLDELEEIKSFIESFELKEDPVTLYCWGKAAERILKEGIVGDARLYETAGRAEEDARRYGIRSFEPIVRFQISTDGPLRERAANNRCFVGGVWRNEEKK